MRSVVIGEEAKQGSLLLFPWFNTLSRIGTYVLLSFNNMKLEHIELIANKVDPGKNNLNDSLWLLNGGLYLLSPFRYLTFGWRYDGAWRPPTLAVFHSQLAAQESHAF